jgi:hypothetical protein
MTYGINKRMKIKKQLYKFPRHQADEIAARLLLV